MPSDNDRVAAFEAALEREYAARFPRSRRHYDTRSGRVLDGTSHAIRWNRPFMPVVRRAEGSTVEDLDGHRILDYWQGHFANLHGHNPPHVREALFDTFREGRGLQSGMIHEVEAEVAELVCDATGSECLRFTTSGSLGTFYATVLARAYTGRGRVLKVAGGWHGSQPFGLKGVTARNRSFDHLESEGLSAGATEEIVLTRFNDIDDLRSVFRRQGERLACFVIEPVLGAGGGMVARRDYLLEARRLTAEHGALLLCDEIITAFRFRAGDCAALYGVQPDLLILGKILGGGMPVAAVAGRRRVLELCTRAVGRVKFEGGTYSAHELSLVAARAELRHLREHGEEIYPRLAVLGERARRGIEAVARSAGLAIQPVGTGDVLPGSSLVLAHAVRDDGTPPACPEELAARAHPRIGERLLKATLLLEDVSVRTGLGAISTAHTEADVDRSLEALGAALARFRKAGLV